MHARTTRADSEVGSETTPGCGKLRPKSITHALDRRPPRRPAETRAFAERKRLGIATGGARADSASAATRAIARRAPAGRREPVSRSRDARSSPCTTSAAQSAPCAACWCSNRCDSRELVTKRTIGADPLPKWNRVRPPRSAYVDLLLGRARLAPRGERGAHPSLPCRRRHRARARLDDGCGSGPSSTAASRSPDGAPSTVW